MDRRERTEDPIEAMRAAQDGRQAMIWTALPGLIQSFDPEANTCEVQPALKGVLYDRTGAASLVDMPLLLDCPVVFPGGGGVTLTFALEEGDECLVVFSSRCIDGWWQSGGVQAAPMLRMHDLSDGFVIPGPRSKARPLASLSTSKAQLRSEDGNTYVELDPEGQKVAIKAPGGATITANVEIQGTLHVTGNISSDADVTASGISLKTHRHTGVQAGGSNTGTPI